MVNGCFYLFLIFLHPPRNQPRRPDGPRRSRLGPRRRRFLRRTGLRRRRQARRSGKRERERERERDRCGYEDRTTIDSTKKLRRTIKKKQMTGDVASGRRRRGVGRPIEPDPRRDGRFRPHSALQERLRRRPGRLPVPSRQPARPGRGPHRNVR